MSALSDRVKNASTETLLALLEFFDCERLRHYYTGLIEDVRRELGERGATDVQTSGASVVALFQSCPHPLVIPPRGKP